MTDTTHRKVPVSFALQGGGQLGAFQLGVITAFLMHPGVGEVQVLSGSSAGGINSFFTAMLEMLNLRDAPEKLREVARECWPGLSIIPTNTQEVFQWLQKNVFGESGTLREAADWAFSPLSRLLENGTIHQIENIATVGALAPILMALPEKYKFRIFKALLNDRIERQVDFETLRQTPGPEIHVAGASEKTDSTVLYTRKHASGLIAMITSAVPFIFPSIRTMVGADEHVFVDGALTANPPIKPHVMHGGDCVVVKLMDAPEDAYHSVFRTGIHLLRMFKDSGMIHEIRGAQEINRDIEAEEAAGLPNLRGKKKCFFHMISDEDVVRKYGLSSALNFNAGLARQMFDDGLKAGQNWLEKNYDRLGVRSTYLPPSLDPDDYENGAPELRVIHGGKSRPRRALSLSA